MKQARYCVHKLIQDLLKDDEAARSFRENPEPAFKAYGLNKTETAALHDGGSEALIKLGVHPNLQMKYFRIKTEPGGRKAGPLASYLARLQEE